MLTRNDDDRTIARWRTEPQWRALEFEESTTAEQAPPLWKDLTLASIVALLFWMGAVAMLR